MANSFLPFRNRAAAGEKLAEQLHAYTKKPETVVLAMVRGGVVIGRAIADTLQLPLYPYVVRKLGHPHHREYGVGAIAEGGATYIDDATMNMMDLSWKDLEPVIEEEKAELKRRQETYLVSARPPLLGKTVILVDDGAATGSTLFAAIEDVRNAKVGKLIVALPVCPPDTAQALLKRCDAFVILATPEPFEAVGKWYEEFPQVEDDEVLRLLSSNAEK